MKNRMMQSGKEFHILRGTQQKCAFALTMGLVLAALFGAGETVCAAETDNALNVDLRGGVLYDGADLLTDEEEQALVAKIQTLQEETGWTIFAASTDDAGGRTAQAYADDFYDANTDGDGLVILIDMDNRELTVSTAGEAISYLTDSRIDTMLDDGYEYVSDGDYYDCYETMLSDVSYFYGKGIPDNAYTYDAETGKITRYHAINLIEFFTALVMGVVVFAAVFLIVTGGYRLKFGTYQYDCHEFGKVSVRSRDDRLVNQMVTHRRIPQHDEDEHHHSSGSRHSSSGRSTVHRSSSGRSHGGGSRKF